MVIRKIPHAIVRARQRYGLKLSTDDLRVIALQCAEGSCRLAYLPNGRERHLVEVHGRALVVVYRPHLGVSSLNTPHQGAGSIITILPRESVIAGAARSPASHFKSRKITDYKRPKKRRQREG